MIVEDWQERCRTENVLALPLWQTPVDEDALPVVEKDGGMRDDQQGMQQSDAEAAQQWIRVLPWLVL